MPCASSVAPQHGGSSQISPIANPGRASLDAALDPSDTGYYYFVLNPKTGTHEYSKTYAEHQQKVEEFAKLEGQ